MHGGRIDRPGGGESALWPARNDFQWPTASVDKFGRRCREEHIKANKY